MSEIRDVVNDALVKYIQRQKDPHAADVLKVYEEIEHVLLEDQVSYGAEDKYYVKIIYRRVDESTATHYFSGTFGELIRGIVDYEEDR